jgi:ATP-dependent helicase/nuclease subunit A
MTVDPSILTLFQLTDDQHSAATARDAAISVTAGAGSGKTRALVGRYLALLEQGFPLRSLVAITFTDKAAREMRNRIRAITTNWLEQEDAAANRALWTEAFSALDAARIGTIHGLCAAILRTHPAEAGLDPAFGVLDEGQSAVWRARAVEAGLAWATTEAEVVHLFSLFKEAQLRRLLANLLDKRLDAEQILANLAIDPLERWGAGLDQWFAEQLNAPLWQASLATLAALQAKKEDDKLEIARRMVLARWEEARQVQPGQEWEGFFAALLGLRGAIPGRGGQKANWAADDLAVAQETMRTLRSYFDQGVSRLLNKKKPISWALDSQVAELLPLVRRLFDQTREIYQGYKGEAQTLDFDDLEQMTAQLLTNNETVRTRWQVEINAVLLVDEFQDTNQRQREIVYALAGFEPPETRSKGTGFSKTDQLHLRESSLGVDYSPKKKPASLFVVGDSKQSIYRFRGADVAVFRQVQEDIRQAGGTLIDFDLTFRAHKSLVELTNALLAPLMAAEDDTPRPYDVPFAPLMAYRPEPRAGMEPPYLEFHLGLGEDKSRGRLAAATGLAERLHELRHAGQIAWQDVALLFRASTAFAPYEDALEQAGIPYVTIAGRGFYDRPEVRDLLNALAAIADPTDDLAMAGLLRSPAIGLSDGAIYLLRWHKDRQRRPFWVALQNLSAVEGLAEADRQRANFARQVIAGLHQQADRVSVAQLLKDFLDATHYRAILRLVPGGERLRRNVGKLLADAHRSELVSVTEFLEYLAVLGDVGARESEAPTEAGGAVQLMTIHKAKGLEFPVVVLADAGYTGGFRSTPFYLDQELGLLLNLSDGEAQPAAFRLGAWREAEQEAAEERRLLYVAATRAKEKFIISGDAKVSTAKKNPGRLRLSGWLAQLAGVVGLSETQLPGVPATAQSIPLTWEDGAATCTIYPPVQVSPTATPVSHTPSSTIPGDLPDLLAAFTAAPSTALDQKLQERESDPPPRVWRVVPQTQYDVPAWVIGSLTHMALRYWRFPDEHQFPNFLRPFALEAGLTDQASLDIALSRVSALLVRFQEHPLYGQLSAAERHHEVPYNLTLDGEMRSGIIDLLFRSSTDTVWTIAEFKTDRLAEKVDLEKYAQEKKYDRQVEAYRQAITHQVGTTPQVLLVFLNVGQSVQILNV